MQCIISSRYRQCIWLEQLGLADWTAAGGRLSNGTVTIIIIITLSAATGAAALTGGSIPSKNGGEILQSRVFI